MGMGSEEMAREGAKAQRVEGEEAARALMLLNAAGEPTKNTGELLAPTSEQVEALARVLHESSNPRRAWEEYSQLATESFRVYARAAYAHIGRVPVEVTHDEIAQAIHDSDLARVPSTNKDLSDRIHPHRQADAVLDLLRAKGLVAS